jgi:transposase
MATQEPDDRLTTVWGLQGFQVERVEIEPGPTLAHPGRMVKVVHLADQRKNHRCPECGRYRPGLFREAEPRRWRDCSLGDFVTYVELVPWRVECCGGTRVEAFTWEAEGHRMTRRFFERVAALCTKLPVQTVAQMAGLSWDTVARIDMQAILQGVGKDGPSLEGLRWIGVDEVSRTGGHVYFTIVTDLVAGRVVWVGEGKSEETLKEFFRKLGKKRCRKIQGVVSDLDRGYLNAVADAIPHATHVLDRFHIVKALNEALDKIRRRIFGGAPGEQLGRDLKVKRWLLLKAREDLAHGDKLLLRRLLDLNHPLYVAYLMKEQLRAILHHPWCYLGALRRNLTSWAESVAWSGLDELWPIADRVLIHMEKIVAGFRAPIRLGLVEGINSTITFLRRQARGFRVKDYFRWKIFQRCSLPLNPYAEIIL